MKKSKKPPCFGTESCGTEQYDGCKWGDECSIKHAEKVKGDAYLIRTKEGESEK